MPRGFRQVYEWESWIICMFQVSLVWPPVWDQPFREHTHVKGKPLSRGHRHGWWTLPPTNRCVSWVCSAVYCPTTSSDLNIPEAFRKCSVSAMRSVISSDYILSQVTVVSTAHGFWGAAEVHPDTYLPKASLLSLSHFHRDGYWGRGLGRPLAPPSLIFPFLKNA